MLTDIITYGFCIAIAIGAIFAWANAETKYRAQRNKIFELAHQLKSAQRDLRQAQSQSGNTDSKSRKYHETLIKIGAIIGAIDEKTDTSAKIYNLLSGVAPEAILTAKRPKTNKDKRDKEETENVFHRMKEKMGTG